MSKRLAVTLCSAVAFAVYACPASIQAQSQSDSNPQSSSTTQTTNTTGQSSQGASGQSSNNASQTGTSNPTENGSSYRNGQKQNDGWQQSSAADANSPAAKQEAMNLVTAQATLTQTLDAKNAQTGNQISAKLQDKVQLKNGPELPKGTMLEGKVTADHVGSDTARMAICFDTAKLNDGQTIPIKATVVGVARPQTDFSNSNAQMNGSNSAVGNSAAGQMNGSSAAAGTSQNSTNGQMNPGNSTAQSNLPASTAYAATWTPNTLQVDQVNVVSGVDLHSRIHSKNSAVFVSQSKDDVKLDRGSQLTLAIGKSQSGMNASSPGL